MLRVYMLYIRARSRSHMNASRVVVIDKHIDPAATVVETGADDNRPWILPLLLQYAVESTFPFIWKLQNHAFVRSISDGLSAVREIADIAYSTGGDHLLSRAFLYDNLRNPLPRKITGVGREM